MKQRRWLSTGAFVAVGFLITAGVVFATGVGSVNQGTNSTADGDYSAVSGGERNNASGNYSTVCGGQLNNASEDYSTACGGRGNNASGEFSSILGGQNNVSEGNHSSVLGGFRNFARGAYSLAAGELADAKHDGAIVFASGDARDGRFVESVRDNEFVIHAEGGVRITTGEGRGIELNGQDVLALIQSLGERVEGLEESNASLEERIEEHAKRIKVLEEIVLPSPPVPTPTPPPLPFIEAEAGRVYAPFRTYGDDAASGEEYISAESGSNASSPRREARYRFEVEADGTYWLWARLWAADDASDAIYIGIDGSWARVYPDQKNAYRWTRVGPERDRTGKYGVELDAGQHEIHVGHAEIGARLDALFITDDWDVRP